MFFGGGRGGHFFLQQCVKFRASFPPFSAYGLTREQIPGFWGCFFFFFSTSRKNSEQHLTFPPLAALRPNPCFSESNFKKGKTYPIQKTGSRRNSTSLLRGGGAFWDDHIIMKRG